MQTNYETFGNYILLEKLAAGGMAEVYLAKKMGASGVQKFVAVKRILQQFSDSKDFIAMFKDEAKIAINLSHSNVVTIYDFGMQNSQFYIVMEFVEGRNLRQILNRMKRVDQYFSVAQVAHIVKHVAAGLDHAHRCIDPTTGQPLNIIHRDMSPQNVMLSFEGDAKVVDFGIAKAAHQIEATRAGTLKGKFGYMSPEQVEGNTIDSRTDIFALGIMAWEMLANQRLFLANSELNTLKKIRECDVPSLRKINPNIPTEIDQIVQKALTKDKVERYQTANDLHRDLQGFLSRFDPDFSVHDLSQFVKGLFSDEIIQIRKKQIAYAQITAPVESGESTEIVTQTNSQQDLINDELSLDNISFQKIISMDSREQSSEKSEKSEETKSEAEAKPETISIPVRKAVGVDFSVAEFDDGKTRAQRLHIAKRNAHEKSKEYKKSTYHDTNSIIEEMNNKKSNATTLTIIFSLSFMFVFLAYLNKFHPDFKIKFCKSVQIYNICPRSFYIPKNLVQVTSSPLQAQVFLNGQEVGVTPLDLKLKELPAQITIRKDGYKDEVHLLERIPENNQLDSALKTIPSGYIRIHSLGNIIRVNGRQVKNNQKVSVPANQDIIVQVTNPLTKESEQKVYRVKPQKVEKVFIDLHSPDNR